MQELICINQSYDANTIQAFAKYNIKTPREGEIVTLERVEKLVRIGKIGLFVQPYTQQFIIDKGFEKEVSFDSKRFTTLLGEPLTNEMIKEWMEEQKGLLEPLKPKEKENDKERDFGK